MNTPLEDYHDYTRAITDFKLARQKAAFEEVMARFTRKSAKLLPYNEIRSQIKATEIPGKQLEDIPLDNIVGSVGRYTDFTRKFLPRRESDQERWTNVKLAVYGHTNIPPIEVYKIDNYYFVLDGHHRISIARQAGQKTIQAYVTEVTSEIPFVPQDEPDEKKLKVEKAYFLQQTQFDSIYPEHKIVVSLPGQYPKLVEQIQVHQYLRAKELKRNIPTKEAVQHWYTEYYLPIVKIIRERRLLRDFPNRTEADLYLWISRYQSELVEKLGWKIEFHDVANELASRYSKRPKNILKRTTDFLINSLLPQPLESGPAPGEWRREHIRAHQEDHLFDTILIPLTSNFDDWYTLDIAIDIAKKEHSWLGGLHVIPPKKTETKEIIAAAKENFRSKLEKEEIPGRIAVEEGQIACAICRRSRWTDLIVVKLAYPPPLQFFSRIQSGFRLLIKNCLPPILAVPRDAKNNYQMSHALLAFDGSPKAKEALFLATYMAHKWKTKLTILTVMETDQLATAINQQAKKYLDEHNIKATYIHKSGNPANAILFSAEQNKCDLIMMGAYGLTPLIEIFFSSTVDRVLRKTKLPVLICK